MSKLPRHWIMRITTLGIPGLSRAVGAVRPRRSPRGRRQGRMTALVPSESMVKAHQEFERLLPAMARDERGCCAADGDGLREHALGVEIRGPQAV